MTQFRFQRQKEISLRQRVAIDIREAIFKGTFKPGDKLREIEIAEQMGISRGPVREAIRDLEAMGIVVSLPYRETVVADVSRDEITDLLMPIRLHLELFAIKSNLSDYDSTLYQQLEKIISSMEDLVIKKDVFELAAEDLSFHETIVDFANLDFVKKVWNAIQGRIRIHFLKNTKMYTELQTVPDDHKKLLECLKQKDYESIKLCWSEHIVGANSLQF